MKTKNQYLRILLIEDNPEVIENLDRFLRITLPEFEMKIAKTEKEFFKFVLRFKPDVILSGYQLQKYSASEAIALLKEEGHEIPLIIFSRNIGAGVVNELLKKGAEAFVAENNIGLLPAVIIKAVEKKNIIDQRNKVGKEVENEHKRFGAIFNNTPEAIINIDFKGEILEINPSGLKLLQVDSVSKLKNKNIFSFIHRDDLKKFRKFHNSVGIGNKKSESFRIIGAKTNESWIKSSAVPMLDDEKHVVSVLTINTDISDLVKANKNFENSEEKFTKLTMQAPVGIFLTDENGDSVYLNDRWHELSGLYGDKSLTNGWLKAIHPEDMENVVKEWQRCTSHSEEFKMNFRFLKPSGEIKWLVCGAVPLNNNEGTVSGYIGTITDITEQRENERKAISNENIFNDFFENSPDAIYLEDDAGNILNANKVACCLQGYSREELIGKNVRDLVPDEYKHNIKYGYQLLSKKNGDVFESFCWDRNGNARPVEIKAIRIIFNDKPALLLHLQDITKRREAENANAELKTKFETLAEDAPVGIYKRDNEGKIIEVNRKFLQIFEVTRTELSNEIIKQRIHPEDIEGLMKINLMALNYPGPVESHYRIFVNGNIKHLIGKSDALYNDQGEMVGRIGAIFEFSNNETGNKEIKIAN